MGINWEVILWTCVTLAVILGVIGLILAFISAKNMKKRRKELSEVHTGLQIGSKVIFAGGIYGKVVGIEGDTVKVEAAKNMVLTISRYAIQSIIQP